MEIVISMVLKECYFCEKRVDVYVMDIIWNRYTEKITYCLNSKASRKTYLGTYKNIK